MPEEMIGGIPEREIQEHYEASGVPGDAGAGPAIRFLRKLSLLVSQRWAAGETEDGAVFLLAEKVSTVMQGRTGTSRPALITGNDSISGKVWIVNPRLANANSVDISWITGGDFSSITAEGLGGLPAVALDFRDADKGPQALFFPDGCAEPDAMMQIYLGEQPIDDARMKASLDEFYEDNLRTPMTVMAGHGDRVWKDARAGVPQSRPEEVIEMLLLRHLRQGYPRHDTRAQTPTEDGYLDIAIAYPDRTSAGHPANRCDWVLELKVIAERTTNDNAVYTDVPAVMTKGLRQTISYSRDQNSAARALCVYDMRSVGAEDETCFDAIRDDATEHAVRLWRWKLLRSAEEGRVRRVPLKADAANDQGDQDPGTDP